MRTVVHLSDLHFGTAQRVILQPLRAVIAGLRPDVVAVSGDLTQRARRGQFLNARAFLESLPGMRIVVPGNHDVPLFNVFARALDPLGGYRRYITDDLEPVYADDEIVVAGVNTTRVLTIKGGAIGTEDVQRVCGILRERGADKVKIVVGHHPFGTPDPQTARTTVAAAQAALQDLARCGTDILLTGHLHISYTGHTAHRYNIGGRSAIVVEAGTATSVRLRGEANAFNVLNIESAAVVVQRFEWQPAGAFEVIDTQRFKRADDGWSPQ